MKKSYSEDGVIFVYEKTPFQLVLVGEGLERVRGIKMTTANNSYKGPCTGPDGHYQVRRERQQRRVKTYYSDGGLSGRARSVRDCCVEFPGRVGVPLPAPGPGLLLLCPDGGGRGVPPPGPRVSHPGEGPQGALAALGRHHCGDLLPPSQWDVLRPQPRPHVTRQDGAQDRHQLWL